MTVGAIIALTVQVNSKISSTLTLNQVMPDLMKQLMEYQRQTDPGGSPYPSLSQITNYGFLPFFATYRPYIDTAFEYQVTRGQAQSSGNYQFSIPLFGDFFSDMVVNAKIDPVQSAPAAFPANQILANIVFPNQNLQAVPNNVIQMPDGSTLNSVDAQNGLFREVEYYYQTVDGKMVANPQGQMFQDMVHFPDYLGERLINKVQMVINGGEIDQYDQGAYTMYREFRLPKDKVAAYERAMGQEQLRDGFSFNTNNETRHKVQLLDGPQTPKYTQPQQSLWIKLLFWYCMDHKLALPSAAIPYGQRFINISINDVLKNLIQRQGSVYRIARIKQYQLDPASPPIVQNNDGTFNFQNLVWLGQGAPLSVQEVPTPVSTGGQITGGTISAFDLYINHIFTLNEIHKIITNRIQYLLIRLFRTQRSNIDKPSDDIQLTEMKYPIEYLYAGATPLSSMDSGNPFSAQDWWKSSFVTRQGIAKQQPIEKLGMQHGDVGSYVMKHKLESVIDNLQISVQQTPLYDKTDNKFYTDYLPLQWDGVVAPSDPGKHLIPFKLHHLYDIQPAGSVNASRIREFFLKYSARKVNSLTPAELLIIGIALNFLLISDGTGTVRYIA